MHGSDPQNPLILSGSRDGTARVWCRPLGSKSKRDIACRFILEGQAGFVNCCTWLEQQEDVIAVAGGQDHMINAYHVPLSQDASAAASITPDYTLIGHEDNVCALDVRSGPQGYIVSGSWDRTARVWRNWECVAVLGDHSQAVWSVLALDDDHVLTASADKLVRLYSISKAAKEGKTSKPIATFEGHSDAVRGLVRLDDRTFASCGNDGNINVYPIIDPARANVNTPVQPVQVLSGHTSFVYSLAQLSTGELASSGEDRSVRIWRDGALLQTITVPAISVWSVDGLPNGDVACASSDAFVRIFTRVQQRFAETDILQAYDAAVSSQSLNKAQIGDVQKENLPSSEALLQPGREGQVKMIRNGDLVEAHQFSAASGQWEKIGEVVGGVGSSQKKLHEGKEFDYVFDVDIADGVPPLKLPYNATENPYAAAQRFLEKNDLPLTYLDQVVHFIEQNTEGVELGGNDQFRDPYTGASSYRPTGAAASAPAPTASAQAHASTSILPQTTSLTFKQFNEQGAKDKIEELNGNLPPASAMTSDESNAIKDLLSALSAVAAGRSSKGANAQNVNVLKVVLQRWPVAQRFPLLDVYRLACLSQQASDAEAAVFALEAAQWSAAWPSSADESKVRVTLSMLALRAAANALSGAAAVEQVPQILRALSNGDHLVQLSKPARVAYATVLLNGSVLVVKSTASTPVAGQLITLIATSVSAENESAEQDTEALYRASMAFGNLLISKSSGSLGVGDVQSAKGAIQRAVHRTNEPRIQTLWKEIESRSTIM